MEKTLKLEVPNADQMRVVNSDRCTEQSVCSQMHFIGGVPWKIFAHVDHASSTDRTRFLSVFLTCCWEVQTSWIIDISALIRVIRFTTSEKKKETRMEISIRNNTPTVGFKRFIPWHDVIRDRVILNHRLTIECDVTVISINSLLAEPEIFSIEQEFPHSLRLIFGENSLNVHWRILALHSAVFKKKLVKEFRRNPEFIDFRVEDLDFDDFQQFLQLIYGHLDVLNVENIEKQVEICKQLKSPTGLQMCSQYILRSKYIDPGQKLSIAVKFDLKEVQRVVINCLNRHEEIDRYMESIEWACPEIRRKFRRKATGRLERKRLRNGARMGKLAELIEIECGLLVGESRFTDLRLIEGFPFRFGESSTMLQYSALPGIKLRESEHERLVLLIAECCLHENATWWIDVTCKFHVEIRHVAEPSNWTVTRTLSQFQPRNEEKMRTFQPPQTPIYVHFKCHVAIRKARFAVFPEKFRYWKAPGKLTNVALRVGGAKFYVIKELLATASPYFRALFYQEFAEKTQPKVELHGIKPDQFEELLYMIYHPQRPINQENLTFLLPLADYLDIPSILVRCDWYLRTSHEFFPFEKQRLAVTYRLENTLLAYPLDFPEMSCGSSHQMQNIIYRILEGQRRLRYAH